jgi:broad specificity phosphatase PhoE
MTLTSLRGTIAALALSMSIGGCATTASTPASPVDGTVFVIVRHAEKAVDDAKDPTLSEAGHARALRLARGLSNAHVSAVYATGYRRTQLTAAPTALAHHLEVRIYDAAMSAADFAAQLRSGHDPGMVLVVGHSNTVSAIAGALCECEVAPLREDEYDRRITIRADRNGTATLEEARY